MALLEKSRVGRDINRHYYTNDEVLEAIHRPVVQNLFSLIRFRNAHPAFNGVFTLEPSQADTLVITWQSEQASLTATLNFSESNFEIQSTINGQTTVVDKWTEFDSIEY